MNARQCDGNTKAPLLRHQLGVHASKHTVNCWTQWGRRDQAWDNAWWSQTIVRKHWKQADHIRSRKVLHSGLVAMGERHIMDKISCKCMRPSVILYGCNWARAITQFAKSADWSILSLVCGCICLQAWTVATLFLHCLGKGSKCLQRHSWHATSRLSSSKCWKTCGVSLMRAFRCSRVIADEIW